MRHERSIVGAAPMLKMSWMLRAVDFEVRYTISKEKMYPFPPKERRKQNLIAFYFFKFYLLKKKKKNYNFLVLNLAFRVYLLIYLKTKWIRLLCWRELSPQMGGTGFNDPDTLNTSVAQTEFVLGWAIENISKSSLFKTIDCCCCCWRVHELCIPNLTNGLQILADDSRV